MRIEWWKFFLSVLIKTGLIELVFAGVLLFIAWRQDFVGWRGAPYLGNHLFMYGLVLLVFGGFAAANRNPFVGLRGGYGATPANVSTHNPYAAGGGSLELHGFQIVQNAGVPGETLLDPDRFSLLSMRNTRQWVLALLLSGLIPVIAGVLMQME